MDVTEFITGAYSPDDIEGEWLDLTIGAFTRETLKDNGPIENCLRFIEDDCWRPLKLSPSNLKRVVKLLGKESANYPGSRVRLIKDSFTNRDGDAVLFIVVVKPDDETKPEFDPAELKAMRKALPRSVELNDEVPF